MLVFFARNYGRMMTGTGPTNWPWVHHWGGHLRDQPFLVFLSMRAGGDRFRGNMMPRYVLILGSNITGRFYSSGSLSRHAQKVGDRIFTGIVAHSFSESYSWFIHGYSLFFSVWHWRSVSGFRWKVIPEVFSIQGDESWRPSLGVSRNIAAGEGGFKHVLFVWGNDG